MKKKEKLVSKGVRVLERKWDCAVAEAEKLSKSSGVNYTASDIVRDMFDERYPDKK